MNEKDKVCECKKSEVSPELQEACCQQQESEDDFLADVCAYDGPTESCESCQ